jgi:hypothetical protein
MNLVVVHLMGSEPIQLKLDPDLTFQVLDTISRREVNTVSLGPADDPQLLFAVDKVTHVTVTALTEEGTETNVS